FLVLRARELSRSSDWALAGVGVWLTLMFRPVALSLVVAMFGVAIREACQPAKRRSVIAGLSTLIALWIGACAGNEGLRGVWGMQNFSGISLFGTTAKYLDVKDVSDDTLRQVLVPIYSLDTHEWSDPNWVIYDPAGPIVNLRNAFPDPVQLDSV